MQIVDYETGDDAALVVSDGGDVEAVSLAPGTRLAYTLGERHCAGTIREGRHVACDDDAAPYCRDHTSVWACARCVGECDKPLSSCDEEHAIYLAAFAPATFKVGVTRSWRVETRLREQGADRAARVRTVADGRRARRIEAGLARDSTLTDRVRTPTKLAGLHRDVDAEAWEALLSEFDVEAHYTFDYGLALDVRPVAETMATGTVVGTKGRVLVLERGGTTYAVDLRELVGYELTDEATDRDVQSSLGAFG